MSKAAKLLGRQPTLGRQRFIGYRKCAMCNGDIMVWSDKGRPCLFHNGYLYNRMDMLARDCKKKEGIK